jgi:hypothetical protein
MTMSARVRFVIRHSDFVILRSPLLPETQALCRFALLFLQKFP